MGVRGEALTDVYYTTLLRHAGCTATSTEYAAGLGGNDIAVRREGDAVDPRDLREALGFVLGLGRGTALPVRIRTTAAALATARGIVAEGGRGSCEVARRLAQRFGLGATVQRALHEALERWDGAGTPQGLRADRIAPAARFANVAFAAVIGREIGGRDGAAALVGRWAGRTLDPEIARGFTASGGRLLEEVPESGAWEACLAAEPGTPRVISGEQLDSIAAGFAEVADLKSAYLLRHSEGVASLAAAAAKELGLPSERLQAVRRAALLHDIGRAGVPTGVWDRPGPLGVAEWEQVRLHPYHTERVLRRSPLLEPLADLAASHHERLDGGGYHRRLPASLLDVSARVLVAADAYHATTEERPHRAARSPGDAARALEQEASKGALDRDAVGAVIAAAGGTARDMRINHPSGLTEREVEVLRRLAVGRSMKEIASELVVSPSTVHAHVAHIYEKIGVSSRAAAALFAMEHGLLQR